MTDFEFLSDRDRWAAETFGVCPHGEPAAVLCSVCIDEVFAECDQQRIDQFIRDQGLEDLELLEADVAANGVRSPSGRLSTIVSEARQSRVALARILGQVDVPDSVRPAVAHARRAAQERWRR